MNHYPLWKNMLIFIVLALGVFYALPNIYGRSPVVQISAIKSEPVNDELLASIGEKLKAGNVSNYKLSLENDTVIARFENVEDQLIGKEIINNLSGYKSALNLKPNVPEWLSDVGGSAMSLGLDLMGGVYFLMEVDMKEALSNKFNQLRGDVIQILSKEKISKKSI